MPHPISNCDPVSVRADKVHQPSPVHAIPIGEEAGRLGLNLASSLLNGVVDLVGSCASMGIPLSGGVARQLPG